MSAEPSPVRTTITPAPNGPYLVKDLKSLANSAGPLETKAMMALCRCGGSAKKPFCDGTHKTNGFSDAKLGGRVEDRRDDYAGGEITVHDNRGVCSHAGFCTDGLPAVFRLKREPWIDPDGAPADEVAAAVRMCPSGALSHSVRGVEHGDEDRQPGLFVSRNGPYFVTGGPLLPGVERGEKVSEEHFALCRCGGSKNKPFCDGSHWHNGFKDDKN
jgi:CDGSH-type Zn-finger protein